MPKMQPEKLDEKVSVGGGQTGKSEVPGPVGGQASLPNSKRQGDTAMPKIDAKGTAGVEETDEDNNVKPTGDASAANKASISSKIGVLTTKAEDIEAIFSGEQISEEFKEKAALVYEAAVNARVEQRVAEIKEQVVADAVKDVETAIAEMAEELNKALDHAVDLWMQENEVAIVSSLRANIAEEFIGNLKKLFEDSYISIPEEKVDVVEELVARVEELEQTLDESTKRELELKQSITAYEQKEAIAAVSEGLTDTQKEKLNALAEGVEYSSVEDFKKKLEVIKESYFQSGSKGMQMLEEQVDDEGKQENKPVTNTAVDRYVKAITRSVVSSK